MKRLNWQIVFSVSLIALSVLLYLLHFIIFRDTQRFFIDLLEYIAFVPIQVLMVTIIIDQLLKVREKRSMLKKLNMVIGVFFSEVGINLIKHFGHFDNSFDELRKHLVLKNDWSGKDFLAAHRNIKAFDYRIESKKESLEPLRGFLNNERGSLALWSACSPRQSPANRRYSESAKEARLRNPSPGCGQGGKRNASHLCN